MAKKTQKANLNLKKTHKKQS